jgi:putative Holliday junction resolvase
MRYLGLDLGSRTLGIAISTSGVYASSYKVIRHNEEYKKLLNEVKNIIEEEKIDIIVLGLPKNMNNSEGDKAKLSYDFKDKLEKLTGKEVILEDERLTTVIANNALIGVDKSRKKRKEVVDSVAATIILQSYLDRKK